MMRLIEPTFHIKPPRRSMRNKIINVNTCGRRKKWLNRPMTIKPWLARSFSEKFHSLNGISKSKAAEFVPFQTDALSPNCVAQKTLRKSAAIYFLASLGRITFYVWDRDSKSGRSHAHLVIPALLNIALT